MKAMMRCVRLGLLVLAAVHGTSFARAELPAPLRAVLLARTPSELTLAERVRGQASDLPITLVVAERPGLPDETLPARARDAQAAALEHGARVALWFALALDQPAELMIFMSTVGRDPVLVRRLPIASRADTLDSGLLESAALVVRSSLRALADGEAVGIRAADALAPVAAVPAQTGALEPAIVDVTAPEVAPDEQRTARARIFGGWRVGNDGTFEGVQNALAARVAVESGWIELALALAASLPRARSDALAKVSLMRYSALAQVGAHVEFGKFLLAGGVGAGVMVFQRSTESRSEQLRALHTGFTTVFTLGPFCELAWVPGTFGLGLQLGLDALPYPPRFVYAGEAPSPVSRPWPLQPHAALGLVVRL